MIIIMISIFYALLESCTNWNNNKSQLNPRQSNRNASTTSVNIFAHKSTAFGEWNIWTLDSPFEFEQVFDSRCGEPSCSNLLQAKNSSTRDLLRLFYFVTRIDARCRSQQEKRCISPPIRITQTFIHSLGEQRAATASRRVCLFILTAHALHMFHDVSPPIAWHYSPFQIHANIGRSAFDQTTNYTLCARIFRFSELIFINASSIFVYAHYFCLFSLHSHSLVVVLRLAAVVWARTIIDTRYTALLSPSSSSSSLPLSLFPIARDRSMACFVLRIQATIRFGWMFS